MCFLWSCDINFLFYNIFGDILPTKLLRTHEQTDGRKPFRYPSRTKFVRRRINVDARHNILIVVVVGVVVLLFYAHGKHLWSCRDGQYLTTLFPGRLRPPKRLTSTSCTYFRQ